MTFAAFKYTLVCAFGNMMGSVFQYGYALGVMNSLRYEFEFLVGLKEYITYIFFQANQKLYNISHIKVTN